MRCRSSRGQDTSAGRHHPQLLHKPCNPYSPLWITARPRTDIWAPDPCTPYIWVYIASPAGAAMVAFSHWLPRFKTDRMAQAEGLKARSHRSACSASEGTAQGRYFEETWPAPLHLRRRAGRRGQPQHLMVTPGHKDEHTQSAALAPRTLGALGTMQTDTNPTTQPTAPAAPATSTVGTARSTLEATAPGQIRVIKRNGTVVPYDESKIAVAITKAFLAVEGGTAAASSRIRELIARNAEQSPQPSSAACPPAARFTSRKSRTRSSWC